MTFKTDYVNVQNNVISTLYQQNDDIPTYIIDLMVTNLRKDVPIFIDIWLENNEGRRHYLEYNTLIDNYSSTNGTVNQTYKNPLKLLSLQKDQRVRVKSYTAIADSTSSTPSDWSANTVQEWEMGHPWDSLPQNDLEWWEGTLTDWITNFDKYINYSLDNPLTNPLNATVMLTLNIEN